MTVLDFNPASIPDDTEEFDTVPETTTVQFPCKKCGREAGPYSGRGRKPTICPACKPTSRKNAPRVTGNAANLAAQATGVLVQLNGLFAVGLGALGMFQTAGAIAGANDQFESQAYQALLLDPDLCRLILKSGGRSGKMALGMAYVGMGMSVVPTAVNELRERKAEREAREDGEGT